MRVSLKFLQAQVDRLNTLTNNPLTAWSKDETGRYTANIGNYHLDGAYGGYSLHQTLTDGGGVTDIFRCGHVSKRELSDRIDSYIQGIYVGKGK